ncbi:potassium channel protein [candidate division LCP-89 bacterium B3_LCP]|uniref:Potassium channel protein n=1 Tax=candidate division LCP-89 bacterium B3_LCP TaxID=2012998 RepID=A0A532V3V4_UNCL8|nr:MAG: potassium channel protein [candidate division LCP-89 bacterium B3_LCP]
MAILKKLLFFTALLLTVLLSGATGYSLIEGWSFADSVYMTVITVATVGFKEVAPLSQTGKLYTIFIILVGVGLVGFSLSNFTAFLVSGQIQEIFRVGKMQKRLSKLKKHYIVCGSGRMGSEAVKELIAEDRDIVIIESDEAVYQKHQSDGVPSIQGNATDDEVLIQAGVERAKGLLTALPTDMGNVYVSLSARGLNPDLFIIARGTDEASESKLLKAGADRVILPYQIGGRRMASILVRPEIVDFLDVMTGKDELSLRMELVNVSDSSPLADHTLKESNIRRETGGALIIGLIRDGSDMIPNPDSDAQIRSGDQLVVVGHVDQIKKLEQMAK